MLVKKTRNSLNYVMGMLVARGGEGGLHPNFKVFLLNIDILPCLLTLIVLNCLFLFSSFEAGIANAFPASNDEKY